MNATEHTLESVSETSPLQRALTVLEQVLAFRLGQFFKVDGPESAGGAAQFSTLGTGDYYGQFVREHALDRESQLLILLALMPRIKPDFLESAIQSVLPGAGDYPQLGGMRGRQHRGFLPTGDTALFLLAGDDTAARLRWQALLAGEHPLVREGIVYLEDAVEGEPPMSGRLVLDDDHGDLFLFGKTRAPHMSMRFPAQRLETALTWDDLVLVQQTLTQVKELGDWLRHEGVLMKQWGMRKKLRPGCRALFFRPPGTGKTLTATLLGKATGREVYKVDLSMVASKYIGETEKNLATLFDKAEHKDWADR